MGIIDRLAHAWNAFVGEEQKRSEPYQHLGHTSTYRPDRPYLSKGNERSIITSVYNRIAIDASSINIKHIKVDENDRYVSLVKSGLNNCLSLEANKDQHYRAFIQDVVLSLFDEGHIAIVPIDTSINPELASYDILTMRTGKITQWYPDHVRINVYNDRKGIREEITMPKSKVAIIENPLYAVMNEKNSVYQRLVRKLNLLDVIDEQSGSGKLDLIIQLPYIVKTEARRQQAEQRRKDIEDQLMGSKYGIAYTDGTEKITQLNRSVENNLLKQIEYLTSMLFSQLSITERVLDGTADEKTMLNYMNRTVEPVVAAITLELKRKFLTTTARTQGHSIKYFNEPFRLVPVAQLADIADKFTRNEILTSNEVRQIIGMLPVNDPKADELRNKNLNPAEGQEFPSTEDDDSKNNSNENGTVTKNRKFEVLTINDEGKQEVLEIESDDESKVEDIIKRDYGLSKDKIKVIRAI